MTGYGQEPSSPATDPAGGETPVDAAQAAAPRSDEHDAPATNDHDAPRSQEPALPSQEDDEGHGAEGARGRRRRSRAPDHKYRPL